MEKQLSRRHQTHAVRPSLRRQLWRERYLLKDAQGEVVETPQQMFGRVAKAIAMVQADYGATRSEVRTLTKEFYRLMSQGIFLPNSPTLMNAGRDNGMCLSACFVLPVPDSIDGIFEAVKNTALVQKSGGGTGFAFDALRPTGDRVASSGGQTSGPISFMRVVAEATRAIQQGAFRRGANMGMMSVEHPDILKFIATKNCPTEFENFNLSVKVTEAFMERLHKEPSALHIVVNPRDGEYYVLPHDIDAATYGIDDLEPLGATDKRCYTVGEIWSLIIRGAHASGEPGICFIDRVNQNNPTPHIGRIEATNPCGEQPLLPYESCNLGSINLVKFVDHRCRKVDWNGLRGIINHAVRFLDNVIDINCYPIPEIEEATLGNRKIGLGVMGFADALILLGIRYDSDEAVQLAEKVSRFITETSHKTSEELADVRGTFPNWKGSIWDTEHHRPMRNVACTTIAPTGSISIIAGCSAGIEPIFSLAINRKALDGKEFVEIHPLIERLGKRDGWMTDRIREALTEGLSPGEIPGFPKKLSEVLVTAHEVAPEWHVRIQAAFQKHIDNAVSKTVNLPAEATVEDVDKVFRLAYESGCKGITVYRDQSRKGQTLSVAGKLGSADIVSGATPRPRSRVTYGRTSKFRMGCGTLF
ncbi:MAG: adenosylcobalamin-dependent ribonucleoside-diphosphate reductase, partial [Phycisphaerae bacterium]|nr:adenosylcobalamin-dependent ribonucleoside-diphosphate reductase [Phycisphaerae bacterium]